MFGIFFLIISVVCFFYDHFIAEKSSAEVAAEYDRQL
jgi:hypothetical protein